MSEIALAKINSFGTAPKADIVPPADEPVFILTSSQLSALITKALQPLKDRIESLEKMVAAQGEQITALEARIGLQEDNGLIQLRLINDLRETSKKGPAKTELSRAEKIERYLSSRPDHRATFETLKGHLGVDKARLKEAIKTLMAASPGRYGITHTPGDKRKRALVMLPK